VAFTFQSEIFHTAADGYRFELKLKMHSTKNGKVFSVTVTVLEVLLAVTRSKVPSPFKSADANPMGEFPVGSEMGPLKVPSPLPISTSACLRLIGDDEIGTCAY